jgi:hypothetical protein
MEATGLIHCPGEHTAVTFASETKPQDDPSVACPRLEAAGHKVGEQAGRAMAAWREVPAGG